MKQYLWKILLIAGIVLIVAGIAEIAVPWAVSLIDPPQASVAIIGGADGPTAQYLTSRLLSSLIGEQLFTVIVGVALVIAALIVRSAAKKHEKEKAKHE